MARAFGFFVLTLVCLSGLVISQDILALCKLQHPDGTGVTGKRDEDRSCLYTCKGEKNGRTFTAKHDLGDGTKCRNDYEKCYSGYCFNDAQLTECRNLVNTVSSKCTESCPYGIKQTRHILHPDGSACTSGGQTGQCVKGGCAVAK